MDFCSNFVKFSKGRHLAVENLCMIKLNDVVELYKNFENPS